VSRHGWLADEWPDHDGAQPVRQAGHSWLERVRSAEGLANSAIVIILAVLLLPLVVGPFIAAVLFALDGQYATALFIVSLFGCLALVAIRAMRRGEFGPGVFFLAVGLVVGAVLFGAVLSKIAGRGFSQ
jgi:hypothetical protein